MLRPDARHVLLAAGLVTWAVTGAAWLLAAGPPRAAAAIALWLAFPCAFAPAAGALRGRTGPRAALLAVQTALALGLAALRAGGVAGVLLAVIAGQLPLLLGARVAAGWVALQSLAFALLLAARAGTRPALVTAASYAGFELFALGAAWLAAREAAARAELARVNAALVGTQSLLADSARAAERLRVSRELHDAVGHHLTALALQLEVARHTAPDKAAVGAAQDIARTMLGEVREVVGALRVERPIDLRAALGALATGVPGLRVHVAVSDAAAAIADPATALALFRCAQEALTNAARHARARNLWIELAVTADGRAARVEVRDDGRGARALLPGNGLRGLRERLREVGGAMELECPAGQGVRLTATVPLARGGAA